MQLRAVLLLLVLAAALLNSQGPTRVAVEQVGNDEAMQVWPWAPPTARSGCVVGTISTDDQYRLYICAPDRRYSTTPGHTPYIWIRLVPDPSFLPVGYLP